MLPEDEPLSAWDLINALGAFGVCALAAFVLFHC
jgi:hypothetical protein